MASFEIADCPTDLLLAETAEGGTPTQKGTLTLTVRNAAERSHSARIAVEPGDGAKPDWFTIADAPPTSPREVERDFTPKGTATVRVNVAVPSGEAPARHVFHVAVTAEEDPDNDIARGPNVAFEVVPWSAPPPPPATGGFPWWAIVVAGVLALIVAAAVVYLVWFRPEPLTPPEVQGFVLRCKGGPAMVVGTAADGSLVIPFKPTADGTASIPPQDSECGWIDRPLGPTEPKLMLVSRAVPGSNELPDVIASLKPFEVTAYNNNTGGMVVTKIDF